jgi:hypothetical protein
MGVSLKTGLPVTPGKHGMILKPDDTPEVAAKKEAERRAKEAEMRLAATRQP